jgi:preprotein translocase subunit SecA
VGYCRPEKALEGEFGINLPVNEWLKQDEHLHETLLRERILEGVAAHFQGQEVLTGPQVMRHFEKALMLNVLDQKWKDHLASMDYLRQGIGLRGYAQKQPMQEYKRESFGMFTELLDGIKHEVIRILARVQVKAEGRRAVEASAGRGAADAVPPRRAGRHGAQQPKPMCARSQSRPQRPCLRLGQQKYKQCYGKREEGTAVELTAHAGRR